MKARYRLTLCSLFLACGLLIFLGNLVGSAPPQSPVGATLNDPYIEAPMSLGSIVNQCTNVVLVRVESVDPERKLIIYHKVRDLKGKHPQDVIKHNIGTTGLRANEWKKTMDWAEKGKLAVFFHNQSASETCIGNWWYQCYLQGEWWRHSHGEPYLLRSYAGPTDKLADIVTDMMQGKEAIATCMVDGNKEDLHNARAMIQRLKVSLKIQDYNPKRDFVGFGPEPTKPGEEKLKKPAGK